MPDQLTTNKSMDLVPPAGDPGTWDGPTNANWSIVDSALGDLTVLNAQGLTGVQAFNLPQCVPANIIVTGVPAGPVTYQLAAGVGGFYFVGNLCTGANAAVSFGSASAAPTVSVPGAGVGAAIVIDPTYGARRADSIAEEAVGPAGAVQYAGANGFFAGDAGLTYNSTTQALTVGGGLVVTAGLSVGGFVTSRLILNQGGASTRPVVIPYGATSMAMDCSKSNVFTSTLTGNVTGAVAISNMDDGQTINWRIQQDDTGHRTMAWPANFTWAGGTADVLSTGASAVDLLVATFFASPGAWLANLVKGFA